MKLANVFILICLLICNVKVDGQNIDTLLTNHKLTQIAMEKDTSRIIHFSHCGVTTNEDDFPLFYINEKC